MSVCVVSSMLMPLWWVEEMPCSAWKSLRVVVVVVACVCLQAAMIESTALGAAEEKRFASTKLWVLVRFFFKLALNKSSSS